MTVTKTEGEYHHLEHDEVAKMLGCDLRCGLTANEVEQRRARFGVNEISESKPIGPLMRL